MSDKPEKQSEGKGYVPNPAFAPQEAIKDLSNAVIKGGKKAVKKIKGWFK